MRRLMIILSCALCIQVVAQTNVAVYVSGLDSTYDATKEIIGSEMAVGIISMSEYNAVNRTEDFQKLLKEGYNSIDNQKILDLGKQFESKIVCIVNVMPYQNTFYIQAKMQNANNAKILSTARVSSSLETLDEILRATEELSNNLMTQLNARRQEVKQRELEQERAEAERTRQEQERMAQEQARKAQERALEEQRQQELMEQSLEMFSESLDGLGQSINKLRQVKNSYALDIKNTTKNPYRINLDGHILGVVNPYKTERFIVSVEIYGRMQAVQTSGYVFSPTIKEFKIPRQQKQTVCTVTIK